jgi:hypothetical protein
MGAWGPGPFQNDDASDWAWDLESDDDGSVVIEALSLIVDTPIDEQPEASDCNNALAAAEVVASAWGPRSEGLPDEAIVWINAHASRIDRSWLALASGAVERVMLYSELKDLWDQARDDSWSEGVADLVRRLR